MNHLLFSAKCWSIAARVAKDALDRVDEAERGDDRCTPLADVALDLQEVADVARSICKSLGVQVPRRFDWVPCETLRSPRNPPGASVVVALLELASEGARAARDRGFATVATYAHSLIDGVLVPGDEVDVRELRARVARRPTRRPRKRALAENIKR